VRVAGNLIVVFGLGHDRQSTVLFDRAGTPIKLWQTPQELSLACLDRVCNKRPTVIISEHRNVGKLLHRVRIEDVKIIQVVHGAHHVEGAAPFGAPNSRADTVCNLANFDLVSVLTEWQRGDLLPLGVESDNIRSTPNSTKPAKAIDAASPRSKMKGAALAWLSRGAQVDHMLQMMARIQGNVCAHLDMYGDGEERELILALCAELEVQEYATFRGGRMSRRRTKCLPIVL
jgi:hypothetical protein